MESSVDLARTGKAFTDRQWRNLLTDVHDGQVAVIVGPELSLTEAPAGMTLYQQLAGELVRRLALDESRLARPFNLLEAANLYLQNSQNEAEDIYREVRDIFKSLRWSVPEPLLDLAKIGDLNLFITTTFDSLLEEALNQVRFDGAKRTQVLTYSEKAQLQDIPSDFDSAPHTTVFHLFGKLNASG